MARLRLHPNSSTLFVPPATPWARRFEKWLRTQKLKGGKPIVTMRHAAELVGFGYQTVTMWRSGRKTPGRVAKRLLESYMRGEVSPPGA